MASLRPAKPCRRLWPSRLASADRRLESPSPDGTAHRQGLARGTQLGWPDDGAGPRDGPEGRALDRLARRGSRDRRRESHATAGALREAPRFRHGRPAADAFPPLLPGLFEPDPLAPLPPLPIQPRLRPRRLGGLRGSEPSILRGGPRPLPSGRRGLGSRLPPDAPARAAARGFARGHGRLLPAHPLSRLRHLPRAPETRGAAARPAGGRLHRLPDPRAPPALPIVPAAHPGRDQPNGPRGKRRAIRPSRCLADRHRARGLHRTSRQGPRREAVARRPARTLRGPQAAARRRPARLHEGDSGAPAHLPEAAGACARAARKGGPGAGGRAHAGADTALLEAAPRRERAGGGDQRRARRAGLDAGRLHPPFDLPRRARGPLCRVRRGMGDARSSTE